MNNNYELLQRAMLHLSQDGPIKNRLADAYAAHLVAVEPDELPDCLRADFGALCAAMHREAPQPRESAIRASVRKMSVSEASSYAALVVRMFAVLARDETSESTRARVARAPVVQLFASEG